MNSDIPLESAAILYLANIYLKQGIGYVYVMVDLICMDAFNIYSICEECEPRITKWKILANSLIWTRDRSLPKRTR